MVRLLLSSSCRWWNNISFLFIVKSLQSANMLKQISMYNSSKNLSHTCSRACTHAHTHTHTHTRMHAYMHAHTHNTHTHLGSYSIHEYLFKRFLWCSFCTPKIAEVIHFHLRNNCCCNRTHLFSLYVADASLSCTLTVGYYQNSWQILLYASLLPCL